jgi:hypothetical protein
MSRISFSGDGLTFEKNILSIWNSGKRIYSKKASLLIPITEISAISSTFHSDESLMSILLKNGTVIEVNLAVDLTVQVTPIYQGKKITTILSATEIIENVFRVYGDNSKFHWTVFGQRAPINVEVNKNSVNIKGDGPYRWI